MIPLEEQISVIEKYETPPGGDIENCIKRIDNETWIWIDRELCNKATLLFHVCRAEDGIVRTHSINEHGYCENCKHSSEFIKFIVKMRGNN